MSTIVEIQTPNALNSQFENFEVIPRPLWKDIIGEFAGTLLFVYISLAGVNQVVLSGNISQLHIAICFALGLAAGILVAGKSGGHLNPAVSCTVYLTDGEFGLTRFIGYVAAQLCGAFVAALLVIAVYYSWIDNLPDSVSIGSFGTFKNDQNSLGASVIDQFVGTALLMFGIVFTPNSWSKPLTIGVVLGGLGLFQGSNGFGLNPARDLSPRMASAIVFGSDVFTEKSYWFWVPLVIPFFGAPFGWGLAILLKRYLE